MEKLLLLIKDKYIYVVFFYSLAGAGPRQGRQGYQETMERLRPFAPENPEIKMIVDVFDERVSQLEEVAKKTPSETLEKFGLDYLLQPVPQ